MSNLCLSTLTPQTPITITTSEESLTLSVDDVLKWLAPNAPRHEALRFLLICRSARVNPFLQEAHLVPRGGGWIIIIDKSGWLRRAEENPAFDGHESGIVIQRIDPKTKPPERIGEPYDIDGACLPPAHIVAGGWARVFRKDRRVPTSAKVSLIEYQQDSPTWKRLTSTMLRKTALIHALRESGLCFGLGGAYDRDEMPPVVQQVDPGPVPTEVEAEYQATEMPSLSLGLAHRLSHLTYELGMSDYQIATMLSKRGVRTIPELTDSQAQDLIGKLQDLVDQAQAGETLLPDSPEEVVAEVADSVVDDDHPLAGLVKDMEVLVEKTQVLLDAQDEANSVSVATDFGIPEATDDSEVADVERPPAKPPVKRSKKKVATT